MDELLKYHRRGMKPPIKPLYFFNNLSLSGEGYMSTCKIKDRNQIYWSGKRNGYPSYFQFTNGKNGGSAYAETDTPVFNLKKGDQIQLKAKNILCKTANISNTSRFSLIKTDKSVLTSIDIKSNSISETNLISIPNISSSIFTVSDDCEILCFRVNRATGTYNTTFEIYYNIELYVNNKRWI